MSACCVTLLETPGAFQLFTRNKDLNLCGKRKEVAAVAVAVVAAVFACILMTMYYVVESSFAFQLSNDIAYENC